MNNFHVIHGNIVKCMYTVHCTYIYIYIYLYYLYSHPNKDVYKLRGSVKDFCKNVFIYCVPTDLTIQEWPRLKYISIHTCVISA